MQRQTESDLLGVIERLRDAINGHNLDAMAACFDPDYASTFPVHPDRAFGGTEQMRKNWSQIFSGVPDISAKLLRYAVNGDTIWTEWEWDGRRLDGVPFHHVGVTIQGIENDRIAWVRLYMEPVQEGQDVDGAIRQAVPGRDSTSQAAWRAVEGGER